MKTSKRILYAILVLLFLGNILVMASLMREIVKTQDEIIELRTLICPPYDQS